MTEPQQTTASTVATNIRILLAEENVRRVKAGDPELRQSDISTELGHSRAWITDRLAGNRPITTEDIDRIAAFFKVRPARLTTPSRK